MRGCLDVGSKTRFAISGPCRYTHEKNRGTSSQPLLLRNRQFYSVKSISFTGRISRLSHLPLTRIWRSGKTSLGSGEWWADLWLGSGGILTAPEDTETDTLLACAESWEAWRGSHWEACSLRSGT